MTGLVYFPPTNSRPAWYKVSTCRKAHRRMNYFILPKKGLILILMKLEVSFLYQNFGFGHFSSVVPILEFLCFHCRLNLLKCLYLASFRLHVFIFARFFVYFYHVLQHRYLLVCLSRLRYNPTLVHIKNRRLQVIINRLRASWHLYTSRRRGGARHGCDLLASLISHSSCGMKLARRLHLCRVPPRRRDVYRCL